jgi:hypothetical protein
MGNCGSVSDCTVQAPGFKSDRTRTSLDDVLESQLRKNVFNKISDIRDEPRNRDKHGSKLK